MTREEAERITDKVLRSLRDEMPKAAPEYKVAPIRNACVATKKTEAVLKVL